MIQTHQQGHWVGDGFLVRSIFSYNNRAAEMNPFLLLDYAGPVTFPPTDKRLGVGEHPHRGFETVTIVYDGEVEHKDSAGGGGKIGQGDVQWMTAAGGIVHEEFHGADFAKKGGAFELIQLWVNLPKKDKLGVAGYQSITDSQIPRIELAEGAGTVRVIAGEYESGKGPARTFSPTEDSTVLFLNGEPIPEPIVGYGPFVMNTEAEIRQAFVDFQNGRMGQLKR